MILTLLSFVAMQQLPPPVDRHALPTCMAAKRKIEKFVGDYREYLNRYEREGQLSYDFTADLQYEAELRARPHVQRLREMAHDPSMTSQGCFDYFAVAKRDIVDNVTKPRLANFAAQMRRRLSK